MARRTGPDVATVGRLMVRADELCEICGAGGADIHHRLPRGQGGTKFVGINALSNLCLLCRPCHSRTESRRELAYENGWLVHRWDVPAVVPFLRLGRFALLDDSGGFESV